MAVEAWEPTTGRVARKASWRGAIALYLASTAKSNAAYVVERGASRIGTHGTQDVPMHFRNAPTKLMKRLVTARTTSTTTTPKVVSPRPARFPGRDGRTICYQPVSRGMEIKLKQKLERCAKRWLEMRRKKKGAVP